MPQAVPCGVAPRTGLASDGRLRTTRRTSPALSAVASTGSRLRRWLGQSSWIHDEFLAACLQREVAAREAHGGESRIRAYRFRARKSLEDSDFDDQRAP